jgi:hypothetical protein
VFLGGWLRISLIGTEKWMGKMSELCKGMKLGSGSSSGWNCETAGGDGTRLTPPRQIMDE